MTGLKRHTHRTLIPLHHNSFVPYLDMPRFESRSARNAVHCFLAISAMTLSLFSFSGCSTTKTGPKSTAGEFDRADTNHDGKVSRDELNQYIVNQVFDSRDTNHDGRMTEQEWTGGDPARSAEFKKRDLNGDGVVTKQEAITYGRQHGIANKIMKEADTNHDGSLDRAEFQAYYGSREGPPG
jgi:Ca2+-binding EF-hand superfamily protein